MTRMTRKSPGAATNSAEAPQKKQQTQYTAVVREILGTVLAALIFAASVWTSVFGMSGDSGHIETGFTLAGVATDGR